MSPRPLDSPELASIEVGGMTRSSFILRGALTAGAIYGAGAVGPYVSRALAQTESEEVEVLNFALGLERLEAAFFAAALKNAKLPGDLRELATTFGKQEAEHAKVLNETIRALGGKAEPFQKPAFSIPDEQAFLKTAIALEETGVGAYNGAAPLLTTADLISAAGGIVQVEARHAAAFRMKAGQDPAPAAFDVPLEAEQVEARVRQALGA